MDKDEAKKILGLPMERLTLKEKMAVIMIDEALNNGASFKSERSARSYVQAQMIELYIVLIGMLAMFLLGGVVF